MSYILDALKKAESERKLGSVPDVHAQPVSNAARDARLSLWRKPPVLSALATLIVLIGAAAWFQPWQIDKAELRQAPVPPVSSAVIASPPLASAEVNTIAPAPAQPPVSPPAPAHAPASAPAPVAAYEPPAPVAAPPVRPAVPKKPVQKEPLKAPVEQKSAKKSVDDNLPEPAQPPVVQAVKKPEPAAAAPAEVRVGSLRELPEKIQREIPALTISGYIYSKNKAERSMVINNRLLREGDQVAPGLTLEQMMQKEAILNYNGYRYRHAY